MNPSTAQARVVVDELIRNDVRHVVLCPGSRNAPLSFALYEAATAGRLTLHVRIDERGAGFLALGLAKGLAHRPHRRGFAAVVCTSGTAVANLHPAVLEAYHSGAALLVVTADRPPEVYGTGANQTIQQNGVYASAATTIDFPVAERRAGQNGVWRGLVCRAVAQADAGAPVHVNIPFREPLVPDGDLLDWPEALAGRPEQERWTSVRPGVISSDPLGGGPIFHLRPRTLVVVGDTDFGTGHAAGEVAAKLGWPVVTEPTAMGGPVASGAVVLQHGSLLLNSGELPERLHPDSVVVIGRPTLSRGVQRLLKQAPVVHVVRSGQGWADPQHVATHVSDHLGLDDLNFAAMDDADLTSRTWTETYPGDPAWLTDWQRADALASVAVEELLAEQTWPTGLHVARALMTELPEDAVLFLGSSNPVRDIDLVGARRSGPVVISNRGVAGIDGSVSSAIGAALGAVSADSRVGHGYALLGDLTFLHDLNGLLLGPLEARPDLTIVVLNDDGGGIFSLLEQGAPDHSASFERVFGTPHGSDLGALCAGYRVPYRLAADGADFRDALRPGPGIRVVEVRADRQRLRTVHERLRTRVRQVITAP
ncbi:2-succinyl-5-enolpyruvyl-6-hydroxy-3-cyclohexene-1-carboxylic-acid synthase [Crossiella cryophila]|uniref:2-succinyl-5-enolpyruvyl-6-hydroxy-3-cyclohexene-1-carboxylate synthase n=1 Tax=Crossiella cryophila TaxID=43355 RepID=A0A7W7C744_9PSEU|nr:2-succinyl-5-enolpyruvyl-6-hydroxy-3-cyclohexene-1-carboxylic-acid synthase [Crossiella cryophila]MBB4674449.1 2-succinyl-5-enolpyruvyl-6-hydroxy-3-cyclohexene-1-carboxylate synthase [Crossiella cryophila]